MGECILHLLRAEQNDGLFLSVVFGGEHFPEKRILFKTADDIEQQREAFLEEEQPNFAHGLACTVHFPHGTRRPNGWKTHKCYRTSFPATPPPAVQTYTFYEDPGHGWLAVPKAELAALGLLDQITPYSYEHEGVIYLEEDCDVPIFMKAKGWTTWPEDLVKTVHQDPTPIRQYRPYGV